MSRNGEPLMGGLLSLQDDVTAHLVNLLVSPATAEVLDELCAGQVAGKSHVSANISSRTRCKRTRSGAGRSKK
jgi:hypothetical protein